MPKAGFGKFPFVLVVVCSISAPAWASELGDAITAGDLAGIEAAIAAGANVNKGDMFGTPLHTAVARGDADIVAALLDAGANVEAKGINGSHPLHSAAISNRAEVAKLLIEHGAKLEARDNESLTPLLVATSNGNLEVARVLLDAGADVNARSSRLRFDAIELAVYGAKIPVVDELLSRGIDVNAPINDKGETLLFIIAPDLHEEPALLDERLAMIEFLFSKGADPNVKNDDGKTVYELSIDPKVRALLVKHGAKT